MAGEFDVEQRTIIDRLREYTGPIGVLGATAVGMIVEPSLAPEIGVAGGAAAGALADRVNNKNISRERQRAAEVFGDANKGARPSGRFMNVLNTVGTYTVVLALAGGFNGAMWHKTDKPSGASGAVSLGVDRGGGTLFGKKNPTPKDRVDEIAAEFADSDNLNVTAIAAPQGALTTKKADQIKDIVAQGSGAMPSVFRIAVDKAGSINEAVKDDEKTPIVMVTDGHNFGSTDRAIERANEANARIFIADVGEDTSAKNASGFAEIASKTGGEYWQTGEADPKDIVSKVADSLGPADVAPGDGKGWPLKALAAIVSAIGIARAGRLARNAPLTFNGTNFKG